MKHLQMLLIVFLFVFAQVSCHRIHKSGKELNKNSDSLSAAIADSFVRNDPWTRYSYSERQGKQLFEQYCIVCHGQNGEGNGFNAYNLNPKPHSLADSTYMKALSGENLAETISFGGKGVNKSVLMPAYQRTLDKTQISDVVVYIETFTQTKTVGQGTDITSK
jgi:mono/diheme cytochrome c family protein